MKTTDDARRLAGAMVEIGRRVGLPTRAVLTAMDAPLGRAVGNALEVIESIETLKGRGPADVTELSVTLASQMLVVAGIAADETSARARVAEVIANGAALDKFRAVIARQGGDAAVVDDYAPPGVDRGTRGRDRRAERIRRRHRRRVHRARLDAAGRRP